MTRPTETKLRFLSHETLLWPEASLYTVTCLLKELEEDLLSALTVLALQLHLVLHLLAHVLEHTDERVLAVLAGLLLDVERVLHLVELLVEALHNGILLGLAGSALLVNALAELLLLGELDMESEALLVHLLHHVLLQLLARL